MTPSKITWPLSSLDFLAERLNRSPAVFRRYPDIWLMHCHKLSHSLEGQMLTLDVTDQGGPPLPPNFPKCPRKDAYTATDELVDIRSIGNTKYNDDEKSFSDKLLASYIFTCFMYLSLKHWLLFCQDIFCIFLNF